MNVNAADGLNGECRENPSRAGEIFSRGRRKGSIAEGLPGLDESFDSCDGFAGVAAFKG